MKATYEAAMVGRLLSIDDWVDVVHDLLNHPVLPGWHGDVLPYLIDTFEGPASWHWFLADGSFGFEAFGVPRGDWPPPAILEQWQQELPSHPLIRWFAHTGEVAALTLRRVPEAVVPRRECDIARSIYAEVGVEEQLSIPMHVHGTEHRAFVMARSGKDYSDEQLAMARQIQPLLMLLDRQSQALDGAGGSMSGDGDLTGREHVVLALLARGLTARAIGHRLAISERTVHKHVEHIYRKLRVSDRLGAVYAASQRGLLCTPDHVPVRSDAEVSGTTQAVRVSGGPGGFVRRPVGHTD